MTSHSAFDDALISRIVEAFEVLPVPPAPEVSQTVALVERSNPPAQRTIPWAAERKRSGLTRRQRFAVGGAISTIAALAFFLVAITMGRPTSLLARMAEQLRSVTSYTYRVSEKVKLQPAGDRPLTTYTSSGTTFWHTPREFRSDLKIVENKAASDSRPQAERLVEHFAEIFPAHGDGIFIDFRFKTYRRHPYDPTGSATYPLEPLRVVRENEGQITRELGDKMVGAKRAEGYVLTPKNLRGRPLLHPLEVWIDPETDLPIEFGFAVKDAARATVWKADDFRWNVELAPGLFEPVPPEGFIDVTPPEGEKALTEITTALKLYAELGGGHYPRVQRFDAPAIRDEMLKLAGFSGPLSPEWETDAKYQRIQGASAGLEWIARIVRNRYHASYDGKNVGPADKDKLLMWWRVPSPQRYFLIYGDLRTAIIPENEAAKLGLSDAYPDMTADAPSD